MPWKVRDPGEVAYGSTDHCREDRTSVNLVRDWEELPARAVFHVSARLYVGLSQPCDCVRKAGEIAVPRGAAALFDNIADGVRQLVFPDRVQDLLKRGFVEADFAAVVDAVFELLYDVTVQARMLAPVAEVASFADEGSRFAVNSRHAAFAG